MDKKIGISVIVLTFNEENNLPACLDSIVNFVDEIIIVDSFSTDATLDIASRYTKKIFQHKFVSQSSQFLWALKTINITHEWILRLDADERWTAEGFTELRDIIEQGRADGVYVKMKIFFMDGWMRHGGMYPNLFLRAYKKTKGSIEDRWMDEHIKVDGRTVISSIDVIESNYDRQKDIGLWTTKHNNYSTREAVDYLLAGHDRAKIDTIADPFGNSTERKRWVKENVYSRLPLFIRPFLYFVYRYFLKLGFLDGKRGLIFHTLHAFWYRFLVDAKIYQIEKIAQKEKKNVRQVIRELYGMEV